ncbi:prolipoprotein diacylglyceryl transferase [Chloroflexota bacterium]
MITINIDPVIHIGPISITWYGVMVALAVLTIVSWLLWQVKRGANISYNTALTAALIGIPSGVIIAKLIHVVDNIVVAKLHPELVSSGAVIDYTQYPELIFSGAGLTAWGAVLGAALGIWIYSRFSKFQYVYFIDTITPGIILSQAVGRVGCVLNGCCYGVAAPDWWPLSIVYTHPNSGSCTAGIVHPTHFYELIYNLIVFGVLLLLKGKLKPDGSLFLVYLSLYSAWRIGIGFLREGTPFLFGLHQAQVIGIIILAIAIPLLVMKTRWIKPEDRNQPVE